MGGGGDFLAVLKGGGHNKFLGRFNHAEGGAHSVNPFQAFQGGGVPTVFPCLEWGGGGGYGGGGKKVQMHNIFVAPSPPND